MKSVVQNYRITHLLLMIFSLATVALVQGCGHDDDDAPPPPPPPTYSIGGVVTQLSGSGLKLQNNGNDEITISGDGSFTFTTPLTSGAEYAVTISQQPTGENCTVRKGTGFVSNAKISDVSVLCDADATGYYNTGKIDELSLQPNP